MSSRVTTLRASQQPHELGELLARADVELVAADVSQYRVLDSFDGRVARSGHRLTVRRSLAADGDGTGTNGDDTGTNGDGTAGSRADDRAGASSEPAFVTLRAAGAVDVEVRLDADPVTAVDFPPGPLRRRVAELLDVRVLLPLLTVTARRTAGVHRGDDGGGATRFTVTVLDDVTVHDGAAVLDDGIVRDGAAVLGDGIVRDHVTVRDDGIAHGGETVLSGGSAASDGVAGSNGSNGERALDERALLADKLPGSWVIVEERRGYVGAAADLLAALVAAGYRATDVDVFDAAAGAARVDLQGTRIEPGIALDRRMSAATGVAAVLANLRAAIAANHAGTVAAIDPEFLHDLRVALRRTRAIVGVVRRVMPAADRRRARDEFRWLGQVTSPVRDLDVYQLEWSSYVDGFDAETVAALEPVRQHLDGQRGAAHRQLAVELTSARADELWAWWDAWLRAAATAGAADDDTTAAAVVDAAGVMAVDAEPADAVAAIGAQAARDDPTADLAIDPAAVGAAAVDAVDDAGAARPSDADRPLGKVVARLIRRAHRRMIERGRAIGPASPATDVHELRKDAKRLRYLIECFGGLYDPAAQRPFVRRLKALQENLGEHQDADVHGLALRGLAVELAPQLDATTLLAIGRLLERLEQRRNAARAELDDRFANFDSGATVAALKRMLASRPPRSSRSVPGDDHDQADAGTAADVAAGDRGHDGDDSRAGGEGGGR